MLFLIYDHRNNLLATTTSWPAVHTLVDKWSKYGLCRFEIYATQNNPDSFRSAD